MLDATRPSLDAAPDRLIEAGTPVGLRPVVLGGRQPVPRLDCCSW